MFLGYFELNLDYKGLIWVKALGLPSLLQYKRHKRDLRLAENFLGASLSSMRRSVRYIFSDISMPRNPTRVLHPPGPLAAAFSSGFSCFRFSTFRHLF